MKGPVRFRLGVLVAVVVLLTACRAITTEGRNLIRFAVTAVAHPFVEAQASAALTQSSFKKAPVVPAKRVIQSVRNVTPSKPVVIETLPPQRFIRAKLAPAPAGGRCGCVKKPVVVLDIAS